MIRKCIVTTLFCIGAASCSHTETHTRNVASASPFTDDLAQCKDYTNEISIDQKKIIDRTMSEHNHRLNHVLWHSTRNGWDSLNKKEKTVIQKLSPNWGKHFPLCPAPDPAINAVIQRPSGEEFLYMHHLMVDHLRSQLTMHGLPCIAGWQAPLPKATDPVWPVPPGSPKDSSKSEETGQLMETWAKLFSDSEFLKDKSLSYIGYLLEFSLHNNMHMRWASIPKRGDDFSPIDGKFTALSVLQPTLYDGADYNWLGNPYSAHVNPVFWKLHGFVDDTVARWVATNNYTEISTNCLQRPQCYQWKSKWTGAEMHPVKSMPGGHHLEGDSASGSSLTPQEKDDADKVIKKILSKGSFRNIKFDEARFRTSKSIPGGADRALPNELQDPAVFIQKYGPCSPN